MRTLNDYVVAGALYEGGTGNEAQVGDRVRLYLDTEAIAGLPEFIDGAIEHPIVKTHAGTRTSYDIEYDEADLLGVITILLPSMILDAQVFSEYSELEAGLAAEVADRIAGDSALQDSIDALTTEVSELDTTGLTAGNMLRVKVGGGLEQRTPAQVLSDIGVPALELATVGGDPNAYQLSISGIIDPADHDPLVVTRDGSLNGYARWSVAIDTESWLVQWVGGSWTVYEENESLFTSTVVSTATTPVGLTFDAPSPGSGVPVISAIALTATHLGQWCRVATADPAVFDWWQWNGVEWVFVRTDGTNGIFSAKTGTSPDPNVDVAADFDGQWYHRTDLFTGAWWQWVEQLDAWIPRFTDAGEPIAYNAFLGTYRKLTVVGADGAETITISAL